MAGEGLDLRFVRAIGGGARSNLWCGMIADATGLPVQRSTTVEASALGAGIVAAVGAGWHGGDFRRAAKAMTRTEGVVEPRTGEAETWARLIARQDAIYADTRRYR